MTTKVHAEQAEVLSRLETLGLEEDALLEAVGKGQFAINNCTANHPRMFPPLAAWAETVRGLRDYTVTKSWVNSDDRGYALALDPTGRYQIAVATGNEATGVAGVSPKTKAAKGPSTLEAVLVNQRQLTLWDQLGLSSESVVAEDDDKRETWILLIHRGGKETRAELSLPVDIAKDGRAIEWRERIILRAIPRDPEPIRVVPPTQPDIDVQVTRRA